MESLASIEELRLGPSLSWVQALARLFEYIAGKAEQMATMVSSLGRLRPWVNSEMRDLFTLAFVARAAAVIF